MRPKQGAVRPFSKDRLFLVKRDNVMKGVMGLLDRVQQAPPEEAVAAASVLFYVLAKRLHLSGHEMWQMAERMLTHEAHHVKANIVVETLKDFAGLRVAGDAGVEVPQFGRWG